MKTVFFSMIDDNHYHGCRTDEFIESFKLFHPDIDLVIFREEAVNKIFAANPGVNFYNCKAAFAKEFYNDYELIINMDTDHLIFSRMEELLDGNYDVAAPACLSHHMNMELFVQRFHGRDAEGTMPPTRIVSKEEYLEAGMIAAKKPFWDLFHWNNLRHSLNFHSKDMDTMNLILQFVPFNIRIPNGHTDPNNPSYTCWYGCASMGREHDITIRNNTVALYGKPMRTYHFGKRLNPKPHPRELFQKHVCDFIYSNIVKDRPVPPKKMVDGIYYY